MVAILHYLMVFSGSALMVYNIYKYVLFARSLRAMGGWEREQRTLYIPIVLLVLFLMGYLAVGIFGQPDLVVAAILFGGSIFVFLMIVFVNLVANRVQENAQLTSDLKAAEESNRSKSSILSSMSHEVRTPLNAIIGLNKMVLKSADLSDDVREKSLKIEASANHLLVLVNDVLDMSRIESGQLDLASEPFSLKELLSQTDVIIGGQCATKGLEYNSDSPSDVPEWYMGDAVKLEQALINILGNTVKFTQAPGSVSFTTRYAGSFGDMHTLQFVVSDTGIGIDEKFLPKIFDTFSQEDSARTSKYGGSGLGLAITKNIIDQMDGDIQVESKKGRGTTFTVTVTLKATKAPSDSTQDQDEVEADEPVEELPEGALEGLRVLMAEDVELNAEILIDLLDLEDIVAEHAENGQIAVDMFNDSEVGYYDAVLMDLRMPVMDGLSASKAIRALQRPDAGTVPIIALTANAFEEDVRHSLQAHMNAHLAKPIDPDLLYLTLAKLTKRIP